MQAEEDSKAVVQEYVEAFNRGDLQRLRELLADDAEIQGVKGKRTFEKVEPVWRQLIDGYGMQLKIEGLIAEGNTVLCAAEIYGEARCGRRLPLSSDALEALRNYLKVREKAGASASPESSLFWHQKGGYGYVVAETLLRRVIQQAGPRKTPGRGGGSRVHDLRHTFVVRRMTERYRQGIIPQGHLPYLAARPVGSAMPICWPGSIHCEGWNNVKENSPRGDECRLVSASFR